jgi:hypothetical protein
MRRVVALVVAAMLVPAVALAAANWRIIAQGKASEQLTVATASGTAMRPAAIQLRVTASPNIRTVARYTIRCRKGSSKGKGAGKVTSRTPVAKAVVLPMARPGSCVVVASATLPVPAKLTLTIRAR